MFSSIGSFDNDLDGSVIILASDEGIQRMAASTTWICDGTFRKCPKLFDQLVCSILSSILSSFSLAPFSSYYYPDIGWTG